MRSEGLVDVALEAHNRLERLPQRSASVSRQISERNERKPLGLPSVKGELANIAVATGCSASESRSFFTMLASEE